MGQADRDQWRRAGRAGACGSYWPGMNKHSHLDGDRLDVRVEAGPSFVPFLGPVVRESGDSN